VTPVFYYGTACLLLASILLENFSKAVICVDFYANPDHIVRTLCENRDKPWMHCCGRCQLRTRLRRKTEKDKRNPSGRADRPTAAGVSGMAAFCPSAKNYKNETTP
jgi:hypothetical protein